MTLRELLETTLKVYVKEIHISDYEEITKNGFCFFWRALIKDSKGFNFDWRVLFALKKCAHILEIGFRNIEESDYIFEAGDTLSRANALHKILNSKNEIIHSILEEELGSIEFNFN